MPGPSGSELHAAAWSAAALLWAAATARSLGDDRTHGAGLARRASLCGATALATILGARAHSAIDALASGGSSTTAGRSLLTGAPGWRLAGGLFAGLAVLAVAGPRWLGRGLGRAAILDHAAPPCGVAVALGRLGCLAAGCCFGRPCVQPWCIAHPRRSPAWWSQVALGIIDDRTQTSLPAHPVPFYLAAAALVASWAASSCRARNSGEGTAFLVFAALLAASRIAIEPLREARFGQGPAGQSALDAATVVAASIALLVRRMPQWSPAAATSFSPSSPGMPTDCTTRPPSGSSNRGRAR